MIRGIGDPLAAHYARCFLCTKAREMCPTSYKELLYETFNDFLFSYKQLRDNKFKSVTQVSSGSVTVFEYLDLFSPSSEWLIQVILF